MREVYLDNAATTKVRPEIAEAMAKAMVENYGNPSSIYKAAQRAATAIAAARQQVADLIGASPKEIIFTGGGSEGDNMLIKGVAHANVKKGRHIITTQVEHHAVLHTCEELAKEGFEITYLPVDEFGRVTAAQVEAALRDDTILVSVMYAFHCTSIAFDHHIIIVFSVKYPGIYPHTQAFGLATLAELCFAGPLLPILGLVLQSGHFLLPSLFIGFYGFKLLSFMTHCNPSADDDHAGNTDGHGDGQLQIFSEEISGDMPQIFCVFCQLLLPSVHGFLGGLNAFL